MMSTLVASSARVTPIRVVAAALIVAVGIGFMVFAFGGKNAALRDYICYWAAGRQLTHHANPYDPAEILDLERSAGYPGARAFMMRNPPTAFPFVLPLGFVGPRVGSVLWSLATVLSLVISVRILRKIYGNPHDRIFVVAYLFVPVVPCINQGQTGIFLLLGLVLFLYFRDTMPFIAGAALLLPSLKPHLFLPFAVALLGWVITRKAYRLMAGFAVALICAGLFAYFLDPLCWLQYREMIRAEQINSEFIPTVSLVFRYVVHKNSIWLQVVPAVMGCMWAAWYFFKHRQDWDWNKNGVLIILVSIVVAPYAWLPDECVVLPAIVAGLYAASKYSLYAFWSLTALAFLELSANLLSASGAFLWTAPAWLVWYIFATRGASGHRPAEERDGSAAAI